MFEVPNLKGLSDDEQLKVILKLSDNIIQEYNILTTIQ